MRIAIFTDTLFPQVNGVSRTLDRQLKYLYEKGNRILIFAPRYKEIYRCDYGHVIGFRNVKVIFYPECRLSLTQIRKIKRVLRGFKPDLLHIVTEFTIGAAGVTVGKELGIPMVSTFHTDYDKYMDYYKMKHLKPFAWAYLRKIHNNCRMTFCPSEETKNMLLAHKIKNVSVISNGVDVDSFNPEFRSDELRRKLGAENKLIVLYVGRVAQEKDIDVFLKAYEIVKAKYKDRVLFIVTGDGPHRNDLEAKSSPDILFTGYKKGNELYEMYASADIFAYPSTTETFGNVVVEAMAAGLPVVAARAGGVIDSVIDGYNGFLTAPKNEHDFAHGIIKLIEDNELRQKMSLNARNFSLSKAWDVILNDMLNQYNSIISQELN